MSNTDYDESRPSRLGLGAKFVAHSQIVGAQDSYDGDRKLKKKLTENGDKRSRKKEVAISAVVSDSESDEESRVNASAKKKKKRTFAELTQALTQAVAPVSTKKKKNKKGKTDSSETAVGGGEDAGEAVVRGGGTNAFIQAARTLGAASAAIVATQKEEQEEGDPKHKNGDKKQRTPGNGKQGGGENGDIGAGRDRKRKKVRSKQKNMRKDTRDASLKPAYRVELKKGWHTDEANAALARNTIASQNFRVETAAEIAARLEAAAARAVAKAEKAACGKNSKKKKLISTKKGKVEE